MKYYAVANGRSNGVYNSWDSCKEQVNGYLGAVYKKFDTLSAAQNFASGGSSLSSSSSGGYERSYGGGYGGGYSDSYGGSYGGSYSRSSKSSRSSSNRVSKPSTSSKQVTKIYVDGASRGNGKAGVAKSGYGVYFGENDLRNKAVPLSKIESSKDYNPTNQRAELHAARDALQTIEKEVLSLSKSDHRYEILTDSKYTKLSLTEWSDKWRENGWKTSTGGTVSNRDIIEKARDSLDRINSTLKSRGESPVVFTHVRGHQGIHGNEKADQLANQGADQYDIYDLAK